MGVDLCGDPTVNSFSILKPIFERAREIGMKITLHCGEIEGDKEVKDMIEFGPDRIGHATWLSEEMVDLVVRNR